MTLQSSEQHRAKHAPGLRFLLVQLWGTLAGRLIFLASLVVLLVLVGGAIVFLGTGEFETYGEAVWWVFVRMLDPGVMSEDQGFLRRAVGLVATIAGLVVVAGAVITILSDMFDKSIEEALEESTSEELKFANNHLVLVGWNETVRHAFDHFQQTYPQMDQHREDTLQGIVILLPEALRERRQSIMDQLTPRYQGLEYHIVFGDLTSAEAFHRAAARNACAIVLTSSFTSANNPRIIDAESVRSVLSLASCLSPDHGSLAGPRVTTLFHWAEHADAVADVLPPKFETFATDRSAATVLAACLRDSGWSQAIIELTKMGGSDIFLVPAEKLVGLPFRQLAAHFETSLPLGLVRGNGGASSILMAPAPAELVEVGDLVIVIDDGAAQASQTRSSPRALPAPARLDSLKVRAPGARRKVLIVGTGYFTISVLEALCEHPASQFEVVILGFDASDQQRERVPGAIRNALDLQFVQASPIDPESLRLTIDQQQPDVILVTGESSHDDPEAADAELLLSSMSVFRVARARRTPVITQLRALESVENSVGDPLLQIVPPDSHFIMALVARLTFQYDLKPVYDVLIDRDRSQLESLPFAPEDGQAASFETIYQAMLEQGAVLVGIVVKEATQLNPAREVMVAPGTPLLIVVPEQPVDARH